MFHVKHKLTKCIKRVWPKNVSRETFLLFLIYKQQKINNIIKTQYVVDNRKSNTINDNENNFILILIKMWKKKHKALKAHERG